MLRHSRLLVTIDADLDPVERSTVLWRLINQVNPSHDLVTESGRIGIDATDKRGWPRIVPDAGVLRRVTERWEDYRIG